MSALILQGKVTLENTNNGVISNAYMGLYPRVFGALRRYRLGMASRIDTVYPLLGVKVISTLFSIQGIVQVQQTLTLRFFHLTL